MSKISLLLYVYFTFSFGCIIFAQLIPNRSQQLYKLKNRVDIYDTRQIPYTTGYDIETNLKISSVWNSNEEKSQLLYFNLEPITEISTKISKNKNDIPKYKKQNAPESRRLKYLDFYLHLENGRIIQFFAQKEDKETFSLNFKRGLASLFQFQIENQGAIVQENDLLGNCNVAYSSKSSTHFSKIKHSCRNWDLKAGQRYEVPLGLKKESHEELNYKLTQDFILYELDAVEIHKKYLSIKPDAGIKIESHLSLTHISSEISNQKFGTIESIIKELKDYQIYNIEADIDGKAAQIKSDLKTQLKLYISEMENFKIGKLSSAYIFSELLPFARITKHQDFVKILRSKIMAQNLNQIIDLVAASQTTDAHSAFFHVFQFQNEDDFDAIERYLQGLSISTRPKKDIFLDLYEKLVTKKFEDENTKLHDTLIQTLSAMANKYSLASPEMFEDDIVFKIKDYILHKLNQCKASSCKTMYIRGLQNLKDPSTISDLVDLAQSKDGVVSVQAMKALKMFNIKFFSNKDRKIFENIFYQTGKKFDSSSRTIALDILLEMKPSKLELLYLLEYLKSSDAAFELKRYSIEKINLIMSKCLKFKALIKDILKDKPEINNYNIMGQKGLSSVLERPLSLSPVFNESLLSTQEIFNGVLKQGNVDYLLKAGNDEISTFKLGLFTSGLSSFVSSNSDTDDSDPSEEVNAGMEIAVQNVHFRPLIFFNSQTELMGHVWSGTGSEPTTAYKATIVQQDHEEYILLQNGATIFVQVVGAKSIDLNGKIEYSIWNRNAQTEIKMNSGEAIFGKISYLTSFLNIKNEFSIESSPKISVNADIDFYSNIKLCIQLEKPKSSHRHRIDNQIEILGDSNIISNRVTIHHKLPGKTLALNQKNNVMCNQIG